MKGIPGIHAVNAIVIRYPYANHKEYPRPANYAMYELLGSDIYCP